MSVRMPAIGDVVELTGSHEGGSRPVGIYFKLETKLGEGPNGAVYQVRQRPNDKRYALKIFSSVPGSSPPPLPNAKGSKTPAPPRPNRDPLSELRAAMKVNNEHIAKVFDVAKLAVFGNPAVVMELLEGSDLKKLIERRGTLPIAEAVDYLIQTSEALSCAHKEGLVHRTLAPSNLFLMSKTNTRASSNLIKVLDFGQASLVAKVGTQPYAAPEREVDARADIWSLGVIVYEMLTGKTPVDGTASTSLRAQRPTAPEELDAIVARCLKPDREERYPNIVELVRALAPFASPHGVALARALVGPSLGTPQRPDSQRRVAAAPPSSGGLITNTPPSSSRMRVADVEKPASDRALKIGSALLPPLPLPPSQRDIMTIPSSGRLPIERESEPHSRSVDSTATNAHAWVEASIAAAPQKLPLTKWGLGVAVFLLGCAVIALVALRAQNNAAPEGDVRGVAAASVVAGTQPASIVPPESASLEVPAPSAVASTPTAPPATPHPAILDKRK